MVFRGIAQEVHHFRQFALGLFFTRNVGERHLRPLWIVLSGAATAKTEDILLAARHLTTHEQNQAEEEQDRQEADQQAGPERAGLLLTIHHNILGGELIH